MMPDPNFANRTLWIDDNLRVLRGINSACIDLIVTDPPFNSKRFYNAPLGSEAAGAQFDDTWTMDSQKDDWADLQEAADPALFHTVVGAGLSAGEPMQAYLSFIAPRLIELHRILKPAGSLYLHCDAHASHYLKQLLDCIFGSRYLNEIVWKRTSTKSLGTRRYARDSDRILFYSKSSTFTWNQQYRPHDPDYVEGNYRHNDGDGLGAYATEQLTGGKAGGALAYEAFKGALPSKGRAWAPPRRDKFPSEAADKLPDNYEDLDVLAKCAALDDAGLLYWTRNGVPRYKSYLSTKQGIPASDIIAHIPAVSGNEATGWPTQKPLALYEHFIAASSDPDDLVFDPFAGCATTMVAAERLGRRWAGVDVDEVATGITLKRLQQHSDGTAFLDLSTQTVNLPKNPPQRTDPDAPRRSRNIRAICWQRLGTGDRRACPGCDRAKYYDDFHLDHIVPRSKNGPDTDENLHLLCGACNGRKGNRLTMSELRASWGLA
ncbi:DNA methyltransferase [Candidatus Poriferisodalis sp.]|uniref:DNA methyltransferase n=1 Tax=Candidatus Poriferisodalis sp. TaxID=3101277 RepID=UPI003B01C272